MRAKTTVLALSLALGACLPTESADERERRNTAASASAAGDSTATTGGASRTDLPGAAGQTTIASDEALPERTRPQGGLVDVGGRVMTSHSGNMGSGGRISSGGTDAKPSGGRVMSEDDQANRAGVSSAAGGSIIAPAAGLDMPTSMRDSPAGTEAVAAGHGAAAETQDATAGATAISTVPNEVETMPNGGRSGLVGGAPTARSSTGGDTASGGLAAQDGSMDDPPMSGGTTSTDDASAPNGQTRPPCRGYATRYWDCCKAHCGWSGNVPAGVSPVTSCAQDNTPHRNNFDVESSCDNLNDASGYTCYSMAPRAIDEHLAYGYAAVPADGDVCGRCYELTFTGLGHHDANDPGSQRLMGKRMIVQATNIGHDVAGRQFDILVPGGGVGLFDACTQQWGLADNTDLGAQYGGFLTACQADPTVEGYDAMKTCVRTRCDSVFGAPRLAELRQGCHWFVDWYHIADNPVLDYREVPCPVDLVADSGVDRRPLNDVASCEMGQQSETCQCDCAWTDEGASCGDDDGSCCWDVCCGM
ncbi:MAG: endoglucanase [Myxococcota bacterium]|nr:endoglucanase [Myxococcota bacterium]